MGAFQCIFIQLLAIAACIFKDKEGRVFPRWLAYFSVRKAILRQTLEEVRAGAYEQADPA